MIIEQKKLNYADYQKFISQPENAGKIYELIDGELVEKMGSFEPARIAINIAYYIRGFLFQHEIGYVTGADGGYIFSDDNVLIPDVAYISKERLPAQPEREVPIPPDLAIEIKSPTDRKRDMRKKAEKYLAHGTKMVWLVFPDEQQVEVYMQDEDVKTFGIDDTLDGRDVLPGFTLVVRDMFR
jgi:Uma2 family endonuclease